MTKILAAFLITLFFSGPALADVVELKTGQRVEGTLKQADQATVSVEVGGQVVTFKTEQVKTISYGSAAAGAASPATDAIRALKALQSVTGAGLTYRDYSTRVGDTKIQFDRAIGAGGLGSEADALRAAMDYYVTAASVWSANLRGNSIYLVDRAAAPVKCAAYERYLASVRNAVTGGSFLFLDSGIIQVYWSCASAQLAAAEKLLAEKK